MWFRDQTSRRPVVLSMLVVAVDSEEAMLEMVSMIVFESVRNHHPQQKSVRNHPPPQQSHCVPVASTGVEHCVADAAAAAVVPAA